jgi:hypothetical protein
MGDDRFKVAARRRAPGTRRGREEPCPARQMDHRMRVVLSSFSPGPTESEVIESAVQRQSITMAAGIQTGNADMTRWASDCQNWTLSHMRK